MMPRSSWIHLLFMVAGIAIIAGVVSLKPIHGGDGLEYHSMLQSWFDHFSPNLRDEDIPHLTRFKEENELTHADPWAGYWPAADGKRYCLHFWLYPMFALPAKALLHAMGANEYAAFQVTNAALYIFALWIVLFNNQAPLPKRLLLACVAAVSPVIWYLRWPSPEAFTWSVVLISLVCLGNRQYIGAAAAASLAAMQNPPVLFLAAYTVLVSCRERNLPLFLLTSAAASLSFIPNAFFYYEYGNLNLITAKGYTDLAGLSVRRTWSFFTDLNQGLLPYIPVTLIMSLWAFFRMIRARQGITAGIFLVFVTMVASCEVTTTWNTAMAGLMRYAVWMIPLVAWFVVELLPQTRSTYALFAASIAVQAVIVSRHDGTMTWLEHNRLATFVLSKAPMLYWPDPDTFLSRRGPLYCSHRSLPFPFITKDYRVTKILTDAPSLARLPDRFIVEPGYLSAVISRDQHRAGLFYLNPPKGAVKPHPTPTAEELQSAIRLTLVDVPSHVTSPQLRITVSLSNAGSFALLPTGMCPPGVVHAWGYHPVGAAHFVKRDGEQHGHPGRFVYLPDILQAGQSATVLVVVDLPREKGKWMVELTPVFAWITYGKESIWLTLNVLSDADSNYIADITRR